ncbi:MAG: hypothetical protein ACUVWK_02170 [Nitrososphaerales archaeon]
MISEPDYTNLYAQYGHYGKKLEKALRLVMSKGVKLHRFSPSQREIWTVVGREGDQLVNESQPYCSCRHFYYRVLGGKDDLCYHLLGLRIANQINKYDTVEFTDLEYLPFLELLLKDVINLGKERSSR